MKTCTGCGKEKELSEFGKNKHRKDGLTYKCKQCRNKRAKEYLKENPKVYSTIKENRKEHAKKFYSKEENKIKVRDWHLKNQYGIGHEKYEELLKNQGGVCAICKKNRTQPTKKYMAVDHCHESNKIRGILCNWCNRALGLFEDNIENLENAIKYLKEDLDE